MVKYRIFTLLLAALLVGSCNKPRNEIVYCDPQDINWNRGTWRIDLENRYMHGDDVSSYIGTIEHGSFAGFDAPFPVLLFGGSVDHKLLKQGIESANYKFRFVPVESTNGDWWIIDATINTQSSRRTENLPLTNTKVLYSIQDGVLSISLTPNLRSVINLVPCTNRTLKYRDVKSMINQQ